MKMERMGRNKVKNSYEKAGIIHEKIFENGQRKDYGGREEIRHGACSVYHICGNCQSRIPGILPGCYFLRFSLPGVRGHKSRSVPDNRQMEAGVAVQSGHFCDSRYGSIFYMLQVSAG